MWVSARIIGQKCTIDCLDIKALYTFICNVISEQKISIVNRNLYGQLYIKCFEFCLVGNVRFCTESRKQRVKFQIEMFADS